MKVIKAPNELIWNYEEDGKKLFLAGSIEMGKAENWQERITKSLKNETVVIFNPRRDDWDSSWVQKIDNPYFRGQVLWELKALEEADVIAMYFDPSTKSPISLLEFGLFARSKKLIVYCPEGFWRKGNVDIVCRRYGITQCVSMDDFTMQIKDVIKELTYKYYEKRRMRLSPSDEKWQWNYKSEEFAPNYIGHILHYVEGAIMEIRDKEEINGKKR